MQNRCPNCGGELIYDAKLKKIRCIHCESVFDKKDIKGQTNAHEQQDYFDMDVTLYTCPTCGAEISSIENAAVDYCLYCGSFVTLNKSIKKVKKPDYIIPFSKTKDQCRNAYKRMISKKIFAPKEFRDDAFLDGFKGIYVPFWSYEYTYGPKISIEGLKESRHGNYIHKQKYNITCDVSNAQKEVSFDASSNFDDRMARAISPFDYTKRQAYDTSYVFGYFADTADVQSETYTKQAKELARDQIWNDISRDRQVLHGHPVRPNDFTFDVDMRLDQKSKLTMIPIWFLTWKKGNRIAYSLVNGDTGKIYSEIPVSIGRYLLFSLLLAIPIFIALNFNVTFSATKMLTISVVLSFVMMMLYAGQLNSMVRRRLHADDKGYLSLYEDGKDPDTKENILITAWNELFGNASAISIASVFVVGAIIAILSELLIIAIILMVVVFPFYSLFVIYRQAKLIQDKTAVLDILGVYVTYIVSALILIIDPAANMFYYVAAILCLVGIALTAIRLMMRYNDLITRPIPHFFDRKAGK